MKRVKRWLAICLSLVLVLCMTDGFGLMQKTASAAGETEVDYCLDGLVPTYYCDFEDSLNGGWMVSREGEGTPIIPEKDTNLSAQYVEGRHGKGLSLDGSSPYGAELPVNSLKDSFTLSFWVKPTADISTFTSLIFLYGNVNPEKWLSVTKHDGEDCPIIWSCNKDRDGNGIVDEDNTGVEFPYYGSQEGWINGLPVGQWTHIILTVDASQQKKYKEGRSSEVTGRLATTYINGQFFGSGTVANEMFEDGLRTYLGINCWDNPFTGVYDDFVIYDNTVLNESQAKRLYNYAVDPESVNYTYSEENINDSATGMRINGYSFDHTYVKPGDTLKVLYKNPEETDESSTATEYTGEVTWEVKTVESGIGNSSVSERDSDKYSDTNLVSYKTIYEETGVSSLDIIDKYLESVICATMEDGTKLTIYCSNIPVMYINSETAYYDVEKGNYTKKKTTSITLSGNEKYGKGSYNGTDFWYDGAAQIKLRGNSTAYRPKRPFKLKLDKKADLLGLGEDNGKSYKSKHWVLLANDIDHSLLRNKLLYDFSGDIGTEFYFHSTNVAVIYNGQYEGVYQLCEHRRVDEGRIDITNWKDIGEDAAEAIATAEAEAKYPATEDADKQKAFLDELQDRLEAAMLSYEWIDTKRVTVKEPETEVEKTYSFADYDSVLKIKGINKNTTGGYLAEMDFYSIGSSTQAGIGTAYQQPLYVSAPEPGDDSATPEQDVATFKTTSLYDYAKNYTQTFEYALHSDDFIFKNSDTKYQAIPVWHDEEDNEQRAWYNEEKGNWENAKYEVTEYTDDENDNKHYSELFDMDSLVTNFIFCEYAMNWDSMKNSFFYYKDHEKLAKIGPQWDFDWCWDNTNMYYIQTRYNWIWSQSEGNWVSNVDAATSWHTTLGYYTREQFYQSEQWNRMLIRDPYFLTLAYEKYQKVRPIIENMIKQGGLIDQYEEYLTDAGEANDRRWKYTYNTRYNGATADGFKDSIAHIKDFLNTRVAWLDDQFKSVDTLISSLGYYEKASDIQVKVQRHGEDAVFVASTTNSSVKKICFQVNGTIQVTAEVQDGTAKAKVALNQLRNSGLNTVVANEMDGANAYLYLSSKESTGRVTGNYNIVCSSYANFEIDSLEQVHNLVKTEAKAENCEKPGNIVYWTCSECGKLFADSEGKNEITQNQTVITAKGHILTKVEAKEATEEKQGNREYYVCSECGKKFADAEGETEISDSDIVILVKSPSEEDGEKSGEGEQQGSQTSGEQQGSQISGNQGNVSEGTGTDNAGTGKDQKVNGDTSAQGTSDIQETGTSQGTTVTNADTTQTAAVVAAVKKSKVTIKSAKNKKKKLLAVSWKPVTSAKGYQIQYALNKKFTKKKKSKMTTKTSLTIKKLQKKKTYYIRVRAYTTDSAGKKVYSKWSTVKKVKIK